MTRKSDTRALVERPPRAGQSHSVSVRGIDNGYVVETSSCDPHTGEYRRSEMYSERAPKISPPRAVRSGLDRDATGSKGLGDAVKSLG